MDAHETTPPLDSLEIGHYAEQFGPFHGRCWFNTAHQGPMPNPAVQKVREAIEQRIRPHEIRDTDFFQVPELLREALGKLISVSPEEIVLGNSTTYGLDLLANGIPWKEGDEVLVVKGDFPANLTPWSILQQRGIAVRVCEPSGISVTPEDLDRSISLKTRLFCTSWVNSFSGYAIDVFALGEVCRTRKVLFALNASQALGTRVLDCAKVPVDFLTCCGYKWLCGPYATGFCWLPSSLRETLTPQHAYWLPLQAGKPLDSMREVAPVQNTGARAWDVFCPANFLNFYPWTACIELVLQAGPERIAACNNAMIDEILGAIDRTKFEIMSPENGASRSTLVVLRPLGSENGAGWQQRLSAAGIDTALREGNLRISPHIHNTKDDLNRLLSVLNN